MLNNRHQFRSHSRVVTLPLLGLVVLSLQLFGNGGLNQADIYVGHRVLIPRIQPKISSNCNVEAVAYAAALDSLMNAQKTANDAYRRWYECEIAGGDGPREMIEVLPPEYSVLDRDDR
ncbi:hypothetical protein OAA19_02220 [Rubripirellula sp.]|nr:hypothetical protein [Rubripirellula sp.]MDB4338905.1 hypothetical protein [Rubripirellula sp.]